MEQRQTLNFNKQNDRITNNRNLIKYSHNTGGKTTLQELRNM
jgi:hypothetical protein